MKNDDNILEVYHAGTDIVNLPDCKFGRKNLDFGQGFYITDIYDQALNFARAKSIDRNLPARINIYLLNKGAMMKSAKCLVFDKYDDSWLDFIVACRAGKDIWKEYDYIEGGVADDRVITTVNLYIQGFIPKEQALTNLKYLKPNNQICILNQELLDKYLLFKECITLPDNGLL